MAATAPAADPLPALRPCPPLRPPSRPADTSRASPIPFAPPAAAACPSDTLIVSDLHLGLPDSRPRDLLELLLARPFGRLVLLGDIVHDPHLRHLDSNGRHLLQHIRQIDRTPGREVVWLLGNHDRKLAAPITRLLGIAGRESYTWQQQGRRCLALHGDCFDAFVSRHARFGQFCSDVFAFCQRRLAPHHGWLARLDAWQVRWARLGDTVAEAAVGHAARAAFDVIVCGHTHEPVRKRVATADGLVT